MNPSFANHKLKTFFSWERIAVALLFLLGALLRLRQYLTGRSLWVDEAMLALNIVNRSFTGMFQPLDYDQGAPIGFLLVEKSFSSILGKNELVLRLFPLLAGLISLWLFYLLLKRMTSGAGLLAALALFVFNPRLVYYSSEVKQYSLDVVVTIVLLLVAAPVFNRSPGRRDFIWLTLAGLIALWFSHAALFVLAGIGLALLLIHLQRRDFSSLRLVSVMGFLWILNLSLFYLLILTDLSRNAYIREYWQGAFLPMPPWSDPDWFIRSLDENIGLQFGIPYAVPFIFALMLVGWVVFLFTDQLPSLRGVAPRATTWQSPNNRNYAIAFACILVVTLTASALRLYPVFERMILFLVPLGLILLGKTVEALHQRLRQYPFLGAVATTVLAGFLLYGPLATSVQSFVTPKYFEHIRPTMDFLGSSWKEGDAMYVSHGALPAFRFYASFYGLENISYEFGERQDYKSPQNILSELGSFKGQPRVWLLFSHVYERRDFNERDFILNYVNQIGEKKREFRVPGTSVFLYLYDLKK